MVDREVSTSRARSLAQNFVDHYEKFPASERFADDAVGIDSGRAVRFGKTGGKNHAQVRVDFSDASQQLWATHPWHIDIENSEIDFCVGA